MTRKFFRHALIPLAVIPSIPKVYAEEKKEQFHVVRPCCKGKRLQKPSELPLYGNPEDGIQYELFEEPPGKVEKGVSVVRKVVQPYAVFVKRASDRTQEIYGTAVEHTRSTYQYITEDANTVTRSIAVTAGGLFGLLLGVRGGFIRKVVFTASGAGITAAVCFPNEAKDFTQNYVVVAKDEVVGKVRQYTGYDLNDLTSSIKLPKIKLPDFLPKAIDQKSSKEDYGQSNPADKDLYTTRSK